MKVFAAVTDDHQCTIGDAETLEEAQRLSLEFAPEGAVVTHVFEITEEEADDWVVCTRIATILGFGIKTPDICARCPIPQERIKSEGN